MSDPQSALVPPIPSAPAATVPAVISLDKKHLILVVLVIVLSLGIIHLVESKVADRAEAKYEAARSESQQKDAQNTQFQQQISTQVAQLASQNDKLDQQNKTLLQVNLQLEQQLQAQKAKDATLPPPALATRIMTLAPGGVATVTANGIQLDGPESIAVTQGLEAPPILTKQIAEKDQLITNDAAQIANGQKALDLEKQAHQTDVTTSKADLATCQQQVKTVKAEARKSKFHWFIGGFITGAAVRGIVKIFAGI